MKTIFSKLTACAFLIAMTAITSNANADLCDDIDRHAIKIQVKTRMLIQETVHYRHTPNYRRLVAETNRLYQLATHIHEVTHFEGNLVHLEADLRDLDRSFHRLEDLFDSTECESSRGYGRVRGSTRHVKQLLNMIEDCIHHMQDDVAQLRRAALRRTRRPVYPPSFGRPPYGGPVYGRPVYTPPSTCPSANRGVRYPSYGQGVGFSIGGGSSRIEFRF